MGGKKASYSSPLVSLPHYGGLAFTFDSTLPINRRITGVSINGAPIDLDRTYSKIPF